MKTWSSWPGCRWSRKVVAWLGKLFSWERLRVHLARNVHGMPPFGR
jgi:glutathione S-transferase